MYQPAAFHVDDIEQIRNIARRAPLAQLVVSATDGFLATPVPLLFDTTGTKLIGHLAKPNDVGRLAVTDPDGVQCLAVFTGVSGYISPSAYPSKHEHGKVVPTWNYETVHVHGRLRVFPDAERTLAAVRALTEAFEASRAEPWADTDAPADYIDSLLKVIVAIEISIDRIDAKQKLSQNRPPADQQGVLADLSQRGPAAAGLRDQMTVALDTPTTKG